MDQREIYIERSIEAIREAMSEKIEQLENRIHKAVVVPKLAIHATIENIDELQRAMEETKSAIDQGLDTITQAVEDIIVKMQSTAYDIAQVGHSPWIMLATVILMGYAIGSLNRGPLVARRHAATQAEESYR